MSETIFSQGFELLFFGMGTVVVFLILLIFLVRMMSTIVNGFLSASDSLSGESEKDKKIDAKKIAAISAAIAKFRASKHN